MSLPRESILELLQQFQSNQLTLEEAASQLAVSDQIEEAHVDVDRQRRCGYSEVVYCEGKTVNAVVEIFQSLARHNQPGLGTRINEEQAEAVLKQFPTAIYNRVARTLRITSSNNDPAGSNDLAFKGKVSVLTAGTSDIPVAEEARETMLWMGCEVTFINDVGVAGPHRLREKLPLMEGSDAVVVAAGMEAALPSVVGGYVDCPVVSVPTSVGYGASFGGVTALLGMLNSCASNVTVVNIDAGFKAGYVAGLIAQNVAKARNGQS